VKTIARLTCILLLCSCGVVAQTGHRDPTPEDRNANPDRQLAVQKPDPAQLKRDADELAKLAITVPADVERAGSGVLPKDLKDKLKRIEKLSKRLRGELALN
jgi:hypothetical protein